MNKLPRENMKNTISNNINTNKLNLKCFEKSILFTLKDTYNELVTMLPNTISYNEYRNYIRYIVYQMKLQTYHMDISKYINIHPIENTVCVNTDW